MPALLAWFAGYLISSLIMRLLVGAGLSVLSFYFVNDLMNTAEEMIKNSILGLPTVALGFIRLYQIDRCISVILSALSLAAYIKTAKVFIGRN
ncbi:DUF2523 family protein [Acinetobacter wuhouensis]|uniref:DUF2523 domain-containing protein n=1 Tax=Acinetobacter wuhouensis TaxID=1879050 RepID=A0A4Q7AEZ4_9GAMM|nr:DUF2523 family protein [Acinetobacter wuhouensis]RZG42754.1 DUF2523 domain-containing protein [Acinetobacter wuhouensis]